MKSAPALSAQARTIPSSKSGSFDLAADRQNRLVDGNDFKSVYGGDGECPRCGLPCVFRQHVVDVFKGGGHDEAGCRPVGYLVEKERRLGPSRSLGHGGVEDDVRVEEHPVIHSGSQWLLDFAVGHASYFDVSVLERKRLHALHGRRSPRRLVGFFEVGAAFHPTEWRR